MKKSISTLAVSLLLLLAAGSSHAEHAGEFFVGYSKIASANVRATVTTTYFLGSTTTESGESHESFDDSFIVGGGYKYWFEDGFGESADLGLGVGGSYFRAKSENSSFDVLPLSFSLWVRGSLMADEAYPYGRLTPYCGIGFVMAYADGTVDLKPDVTDRVSASGQGTGILGVVGLGYRVSAKTTFFVELRYYGLSIDVEDEPYLWGKSEKINTDMDTTNLVVGLAF